MKIKITAIILLFCAATAMFASTHLSWKGEYRDENVSIDVVINNSIIIADPADKDIQSVDTTTMSVTMEPSENINVLTSYIFLDNSAGKFSFTDDAGSLVFDMENKTDPYTIYLLYSFSNKERTENVYTFILKKMTLKLNEIKKGWNGDLTITVNEESVNDFTKILELSEAVWQKIKVECGGNYSYQTGKRSWTGYGDVTTITVKNNKIVKREYSEFAPKNRGGQREIVETKKWKEKNVSA